MRIAPLIGAATVLASMVATNATPSAAQAPGPASQGWPQRTVRLITPLGPGSGMDISARLFAERLSMRWGQPVVVENRQGADGIPAVQSFLSDRDGHSLMFSFAGLLSINPLIHDRLPYDPARDVVPIAAALDSTLAMAVSATLPVSALGDLVALARAQPGKFNWAATAGLPLYVIAALQKNAGIELTQIAYRDFAPAFQDFAQGRIHLVATGITLLLPQVAAGRGNFLMVTNRDRSPLAPDVPTAQQAGFPELTFNAINGIYGWRDMPADLKARIAADVRAIAAEPAVAERLKATGAVMRPGTTEDFIAAIDEQRAQVAAVAQVLAAKPK